MEPSNNRPSVIQARSKNPDEISDVFGLKGPGTLSVIVKNEYTGEDLAASRKFSQYDQNFKDNSGQDQNKGSPIANNNLVNDGSISKPKLAILKLFENSNEDLLHPNTRNDSFEVKKYDIISPITFHRTPVYDGIYSGSTYSSPATYPVNLSQRGNQPFQDSSGIVRNNIPRKSENDSNNNFTQSEYGRYVVNKSFSLKSSIDNGNMMACGFFGCGKTFSKRVHLDAHIRVHLGEKPFRCPWINCGKAFTRQGELKRHEWVHTKPGRFFCDNCGKKFSRADHLKMHTSKCKLLVGLTPV